MLHSYSSAARALAIPLLLVVMAEASLAHIAQLPLPYTTVVAMLPYGVGTLTLLVALTLNQGRVFALAILSMLGYWTLVTIRSGAGTAPFEAAVLYTALGALLPLNIALFSGLADRGVATVHGVARLGGIALQAALVFWIIHDERSDILLWASQPFLPLDLPNLRIPHIAVASLLCACVLQAWQMRREQSVLSGGLLVMLLTVGVGYARVGVPAAPEAFMSAAALMLLTAPVMHTHQMAYRDELTGLPARRALTALLSILGRRYTIAMLDVDHFKKFNDTYGHDVGDQVLKMVAARIRRVGGGGKAFRYGGEEFTVVFPGKGVEHAAPHLEAVRESIADYALVLRSSNRPSQPKDGRRKRGRGSSNGTVKVTISIGMASRSGDLRTPEAVLKAADQALYRAKRAGRNRLSS